MSGKTHPRRRSPLSLDDLPDSAFVRVTKAASLLDISVPTVWRWAREGRIPKPQKVGPNVTGWRLGELRAHLTAVANEDYETLPSTHPQVVTQ